MNQIRIIFHYGFPQGGRVVKAARSSAVPRLWVLDHWSTLCVVLCQVIIGLVAMLASYVICNARFSARLRTKTTLRVEAQPEQCPASSG